ncbi:MAG: YqaE/Pmp3 family membrane protein [Deltaproteobacteria bacterium]|nr:YqaE/Pmp3 family membrane protein [Deltaproteobacteria bacterium]
MGNLLKACFILCLIFYVPGIIHAIWVVTR